MKKIHPIEALIEQGEHQQLDFKFEVSDSKKIARTLSAFANTDGGRLLIGVKDNGNISGVRSEEEYYMIEAASRMYTRPEVPFEATRWEVNGKTVLEVYIAPSPDNLWSVCLLIWMIIPISMSASFAGSDGSIITPQRIS